MDPITVSPATLFILGFIAGSAVTVLVGLGVVYALGARAQASNASKASEVLRALARSQTAHRSWPASGGSSPGLSPRGPADMESTDDQG